MGNGVLNGQFKSSVAMVKVTVQPRVGVCSLTKGFPTL